MTHKKIRVLALSIFMLIFTLQVSSQEDAQPEEETGDPVLLEKLKNIQTCLLYTSPSPRDVEESRMPSSA